MEDFKIVKELVNFGITIIFMILICLVVYKFSKSLDSKLELSLKESEFTDLKILNEKKHSKILDNTLELNSIKKD